MSNFKDYIVLTRLVGETEAEAIKYGDADQIGSKPVDTVLNTFDKLPEDTDVAFCYPTEVRALSLEDAKARIEGDPSLLTEDTMGECLSYMLNEKNKNKTHSDNFSLIYFILSPEAYEKMVAMNKAFEGEGYYENEDGDELEISEVVVTADAMSTMYNPKCAGEFYAEDLVANGYLKDLGHNYSNANKDEDDYFDDEYDDKRY